MIRNGGATSWPWRGKKTDPPFAYRRGAQKGTNAQLVKTKVKVDRTNKHRKVIEDRPEASGTEDVVQTYTNGKLAISQTIEGASNDYVDHKYQFDHLGRLKTHKDPRIGDTTTTYYSGTTQVNVVTAPDGQTTTYDYDSCSGRLNKVTGHGQIFTFSYLENSHLISEVERGSFERHINRQTNSHRISSIENEWNQTDWVNFTYSYDTLGRISTRTMTGTIEDAYGSNTEELRETYTYNDRHELTAAKTESKISGTYNELVGRKHAFTYDEQGNRKTHSRNSHTTTYTPNNLNQYTARTNHGHLLVEGTTVSDTKNAWIPAVSESPTYVK